MIDTAPQHDVRVDPATGSLRIEALSLDDLRVTTECRYWSTGRRGEPVDLAVLAEADLSAFVVQAMAIGAGAMTAAAGVEQQYGIEALVAEVEQRSTKAAADAAHRTSAAVAQATSALTTASDQAKTAVVEAGTTARRAFTESVDAARVELAGQITALLGGDEPQLMVRLQPMLEKFSTGLQERATSQTTSLIEKVARQFDPADPASPMAQQMRALTETQNDHANVAGEQLRALTEKLDELGRTVTVRRATDLALARTPVKGATYEDQVHPVMAMIAAGLGDEYVVTGNVTGLRTRSKKGDGVISVPDTDARVVIEMTDSPRDGWTAYLREAEENRGAQASLGLIKSAAQAPGDGLVSLGPRRIVMAFDPEVDDPQLLRCVVQLLRLAAQAAAARVDSGEIATADELIAEAMTTVDRIGKIKKASGQIRANAGTIDTEADGVKTELLRQLSQARTALAGVHADRHDDVA